MASQLSKIAEKGGKTSYALANECLGAALEVCEKGGHPDEIFSAWILNRIGKDIGAFQLIGRNLMERIVQDFGHLDQEKFSQIWYEAGFNFGQYLQIHSPTFEDVVSFVTQVRQSSNIGRVEFVKELTTFREEKMASFSLNLVTPYSGELLTFLSEYWRGLGSSYGVDLVESKIAAGTLRLRFVNHSKLSKAEPNVMK